MPDDPKTAPGAAASRLIANWKEAAAAARDTLLLLLTALLILLPEQFNAILVRAGFEEGSLVGFTWKKQLVNSDTMLNEAKNTISELQTQNKALSAQLEALKGQVASADTRAHIDTLTSRAKALDVASAKVVRSVASTQASYAELVKRASTSGNESARWAVVFGGDVSPRDAQDEINHARNKLGIASATIYLRQGSYRSVAPVDSWAQAQALVLKLAPRRADAYVVNLDKWCHDSTERNGWRECVSGP